MINYSLRRTTPPAAIEKAPIFRGTITPGHTSEAICALSEAVVFHRFLKNRADRADRADRLHNCFSSKFGVG